MSEALELIDGFIYHAHIQERFKTAQGQKVRRYVNMVNRVISNYLEQKKTLETRKDYARASTQVRKYVKEFQTQLLGILEKDVRGQFAAEAEWLKGTIPGKIDTVPSKDRVVNDVLFNTFNSVFTLETWVETIAERIFRCWDGQMRVAVISGENTSWIIEQVLGG